MKEKYVKVCIDTITPIADSIENATPEQLWEWQVELDYAIHACKKYLELVNKRLESDFGSKASAAYTSNNKSSGKLTVETYTSALTSIKITADISKKVEWNSTTLRSLYGTLPIDFAKLFIDVKFNVSEANYPKLKEALPAQEKLLELPENTLINLLEQSRVVKYGSPKIALEKISA